MPSDSSSSPTADTPAVRRIQLGNTVFEGENAVYVLDADGSSVGLVDVGISDPDTRAELEAGLAGFGYTLDDVDDIVLTHWHADHSGLAGELQAETGATVWAHEADAALIAGDEAAWDDYHDLETARFEEWQIPVASRDELRAFLDASTIAGDLGVDVTTFEDGDRLRVGGVDLDVVHLPGHAAGLSAFAFSTPAGREAFVGDAILPKYTPNVGGADLRVEAPLATYVDSLERVVTADWDRVWPGHRDPIDSPNDRARTILEHHRERTRRVVDVLASRGGCDVWTVSAALFGDLKAIHILHGPGEAWAHLDHLQSHGAVERDGYEYGLVAEPAVEALFPDLSSHGPA